MRNYFIFRGQGNVKDNFQLAFILNTIKSIFSLNFIADLVFCFNDFVQKSYTKTLEAVKVSASFGVCVFVVFKRCGGLLSYLSKEGKAGVNKVDFNPPEVKKKSNKIQVN